MSDARSEILGRIRSALSDVPPGETRDDVSVTREYRRVDDRPRDELVTLFVDRVLDYGAHVRRVGRGTVAMSIASVCEERGLRRLVAAPGLDDAWLPAGLELARPEPISVSELDALDGAITGCATAIAETGTIVLDGGPASGRRALTLIPDHHICLVQAGQICGQLAEGLAAVAAEVRERRAPVTLVSGPCASSDIELARVLGGHGPRELVVLVID